MSFRKCKILHGNPYSQWSDGHPVYFLYSFKNITVAGHTSGLMFEWMVEDFVWLNESSFGMVAYDDDCGTVHVI